MVICVAAEFAATAIKFLEEMGETAWQIGMVKEQPREKILLHG